jgi:hypothetical protein
VTTTETGLVCGTRHAYGRHRRRGEPIDDACRAAWNAYRSDHRAAGRLARRKARSAAIARAAALPAGAKPFHIPRCTDCRAPLANAAGEPRWDLLEGRFVCLGRCVMAGGRRD